MTKIQWTERTWNPARGCSRVSEGCRHCYAEQIAARFSGKGQPYEGLAKRVGGEARWTGEVRFVPEKLDEPLRRKKPTTYFVNSMSDLFHERLSDEQIAAVFGVMVAAPRHTFQVLTKRPERMLRWFEWARCGSDPAAAVLSLAFAVEFGARLPKTIPGTPRWPLPNVWLGVSAEDQERLDERVPLLLQTPAAVRFVSAEPLLDRLDFGGYLWPTCILSRKEHEKNCGDGMFCEERWVDWVIVGGESGRGARPCDVAWIRSIVAQCAAAGVPCFVKQLGARPRFDEETEHADWLFCKIRDPKGGDPAEWPEDLRVREMP